MGEINMKKTLLIFASIIACALCINAYAQDVEMTPYEQQREQLGLQKGRSESYFFKCVL